MKGWTRKRMQRFAFLRKSGETRFAIESIKDAIATADLSLAVPRVEILHKTLAAIRIFKRK